MPPRRSLQIAVLSPHYFASSDPLPPLCDTHLGGVGAHTVAHCGATRENLCMKYSRLWLALSILAFGACKLPPASMVDAPTALEGHVRYLSEHEPARQWSNIDALDSVALYISAHLKAGGARVEMQEFTVQGQVYRNVRAFYGPQDGARILIGAHYDVAGEFAGADDNASGVAALIEIGRELAKREWSVPIELVAYTLEEPPFFRTESMGSAIHARTLKAEGVELRGLINLEMVGYFTDEPDSQDYPLESMHSAYPTVGDFIAVVGRTDDATFATEIHAAMNAANDLNTVILLAPPSLTGVDFSDHLNYWAEGFTAVMITDTSFYRNPNYHEATDTADTLDY